MKCIAAAVAAWVVGVTPAIAIEQLDGYFVAKETCEAFQSKNKGTNPGGIMTVPMHAYEMIGLNKIGGDFFQVRVPDAPVTRDRWVHVSCGVHVVAAGTSVFDGSGPNGPIVVSSGSSTESADNVLALSWQPAFCETNAGRPKAECQALNAGLLDVASAQLSIHGLWPQPRNNLFCGVSDAAKALDKAKRWSELPALDLTTETRDALEVAMPGTQSHLHRHEWVKHGTCHGDNGAEGYYLDTLALTDAINDSEIGDFLALHVGAEVEMNELRTLFDQVFGVGAGDAVQFVCQNDGSRFLLQEVRVSLSGVIDHTDPSSFGALMQSATGQPIGCSDALIDPHGLQ